MPRQAKRDEGGKTHKARADKPAKASKVVAGINGEQLAEFIEAIDAEQARIDAIMAKAQEDCAPMRDEIAKIKKNAAEAGLPKTEFATVLRARRLDALRAKVADKLDKDQRSNYDRMQEALGEFSELPLGQAAMASAAAADGAGSATVQ